MNRTTKKEYIESIRHELIESIGETYNDTYLLKWLSEANRIFLSGVPVGGESNFEPLTYEYTKKSISTTLTSSSDTVSLDNSIREVLKVKVNGTKYTFKTFDDFDDVDSDGSYYTITTDGLLFPAALDSGAVVTVRASVWDNDILESDDDDTTFSVIRPAYEMYLKDYVVAHAKNRNEYAATLADNYMNQFNSGILLARRESDKIVSDDLPGVRVIEQLFC